MIGSFMVHPEHRWTDELYRASTSEPAQYGVVLTIEQLEIHAQGLAKSHTLGKRGCGDRLLTRLADSTQVIARCHELMAQSHAMGRRLTPAAEWLLDNHYLIEEQVYLTRKHFPQGYSRRLPRLASGTPPGLPRIYNAVSEFVYHVDGRLDDEALNRYIAAYQSVSHLTLGELWSVPIMLRLALFENLRRVSISMIWHRAHRDSALTWAKRIDRPGDHHENTLLVLAEMVKESPPLSTAFVAQLAQALQGRGSTATFVLAWLEQRLAERGQSIEQVMRAESQSQAVDQASMANSIASLRLVNATEWHHFVEDSSASEQILRREPAGIYARMDFPTRDRYRHAVEATARRLKRGEEEVAQTAVDLATASQAQDHDSVGAHVGYFLIDEGRPHLRRALQRQRPQPLPSRRRVRAQQLLSYLGPVALISFALAAGLLFSIQETSGVLWGALAVLGLIAASQCALATVNWFISVIRTPKALPRMDFEHGITDECRTMVIIPSLLTGTDRIEAIIEGLELRYLANRDPNLWFGLLTDFVDAPEEHVPDEDERRVAAVASGIEELNAKYPTGRFFLLHRPRLYNPKEGCWMGRERKRGKLEDFNALLGGDDRDRFSRTVGDMSALASVRYVITLDTDTDLPWGAGWRLVGSASHPLNLPRMNTQTRRLTRGYAILQPRVSISLRSASQSHYARLLSGDVGLDPYSRVVSDLYQDLFEETSYIGKGIYDVKIFRKLLDGRFPDNAVLSHDLLESCYARSGQCNDVELLEDSPSSYLADISRRHRWMRGDWQILPWLGFSVSDALGRRTSPALAPLGWWKVFDNLRRAFVAPAYTLLLVLGWLFLPEPLWWTQSVLALLLLPELLPGLVELWHRPTKLPVRQHLWAIAQATGRRLLRLAMWLAFLPFEAQIAVDAAVRSTWRVLYSRERLLEWQTAAAAEGLAMTRLGHIARRMWFVPCIAIALALGLAFFAQGRWLMLAAAPLLLMWLASPLVAWWISHPLRGTSPRLSDDDVRFLRRVARLTWRYFEVFTGPQENWLPPDNFQDPSGQRVAHRTSPTDMGASLLSNLAACDLGYLSVGQLLERTAKTIDSMEHLDRHRGHFYNWYDTITRKPLKPYYISTVDSGNLVGHVRVLRSGLLELPDCPILSEDSATGLRDTLLILTDHVGRDQSIAMAELCLNKSSETISSGYFWLSELASISTSIVDSHAHGHPEAAWWASAFDRQVRALLADLVELAPWLILVESLDIHSQALMSRLDGATSLESLGMIAREGLKEPCMICSPKLQEALQLCAHRVSLRLTLIDSLALKCLAIAEEDFTFLYDAKRKLLAIGYWISELRLDSNSYDLLASEARLASYIGIALGQLPFDHWFALGRRLTAASGRQVLLSWSGSMFEYLMPLLVMPGYEGTLLSHTCNIAVSRQIEYGRQRGVPWGISESCYNTTDVEGTYQYRAFGVPGLGLQRGLSDDLVIAPYASALALIIDPQRACSNLRRLVDDAYIGPYGLFEAVDFTTSRVPIGSKASVVRAFMAHHHGMSLLAIEHAVLGPKMQTRFLMNPDFRAATLLLHERVPKAIALIHPHGREALASRRSTGVQAEPVMRVLTTPNAPVPEVQLLSNGRYHVMISAAGGGYSRWNDLAVTRWREDPTTESYGHFCYVGDVDSEKVWSNTFQPTLRAGRHYEAVFSAGRAEYRRHDDQIETHTEIAVATEDDLEIRRIKLTNRSAQARTLLVTSYTEVVLAASVTDELSRAFSNLFVQTEFLPDSDALLVTRRPRSSNERPPWMFALMLTTSPEVGASSYETDRARFIGRGRTLRSPAALSHVGPLPNTTGAVLDPCLAIRRPVKLAADHSAVFDLIMGVAPSRDAAMRMITKYQDRRMADRIFEAAATHSRATLGHLEASEAELLMYGQLASAVIFPILAYRAQSSLLRRNRKGQPSLWAYALSGDLPIILLRVSDVEHLPLVSELLQAHVYWRMRGLMTDLVIWNEENSGYRRVLNDQILQLVASGMEAQILDKPGGVFVRYVDSFPEDDRVLLQSVARVVLFGVDGSLTQQLARWRAAVPSRASLIPPLRYHPAKRPVRLSHQRELVFDNGTGGFTPDGREYIVRLSPDRIPPAPWVNVIANERIGTVVSEAGSAYTWAGNAQQYRLTPWHNDPICDSSGECILIRDEFEGNSFSPTPWPGTSPGAYVCRHGFGYSVFEHQEGLINTELTTYVDIASPVKYWLLKIKNNSSDSRTLNVFGSVDLVLGELRSRQAMHIVTELEPLTGAVLARNYYNGDYADSVAFFDCSESNRSVSGDRTEFLGRNGDSSNPAAIRLRKLSGQLGPGLDPSISIQARVEIPGNGEREVVFILGAGRDIGEAVSLIQRHRSLSAARVSLSEIWQSWNEKLGVLYAETPDPAMDILFNGWLPYQVLSCRLWGRSGFYQSGGAFGYRDQLQDCLAMLHEAPTLCRQHLIRCAGRQFIEGDVQHWWHPKRGHGVRTSCSDDYLWLPYGVARYVKFTGDLSILDEQLPYLADRALSEGEESYFDLPGRSGQSGTVYEHCTRAILHSEARGVHGLPLMGSGDWNDGMNRIGHLGQGESVWLAFFLHDVLTRFSAVSRLRGDEEFSVRCLESAQRLETQLEAHAWDGHWYLRAWFDTGEAVGSAGSLECRIDALPQSWATLSNVGTPARRDEALNALWEHLVSPEKQLIQLFSPPYDHSELDPGYIKGYPPGVRENGGQYTHSAVWAAMAFALAGRSEQAQTMIALLNPINHALDPAGVERYKVEPYVLSADIYSQSPHVGRGGWTWYTGSAAWLYRLMHETIFGIERVGDILHFRPNAPESWSTFKVHYRYQQTFYHLEYILKQSCEEIILDGLVLTENFLRLVNDKREHIVEIRLSNRDINLARSAPE